ncbi:MAG: transcriptional regulator [Actinomycetota bacterium]
MKPADLDPVIHAPKRLAIMATLRGGTLVEFRYLKNELELSDSDLSKQMTALSNAGFVATRKKRTGANRSTWYRMTAKGRRAFDAHVASLEVLLALSDQLDDVTEPDGAHAVDGGSTAPGTT